eukprot:SAG22_NODE_96_length_20771_cov_33.186018_8_plen_321_part_00
MEDSSFFFIPLYNAAGAVTDNERGQRPSVILRGYGDSAATWAPGGVNSVYLVYFTRVIFSGGAVQYQQLAPSNQCECWYILSRSFFASILLPFEWLVADEKVSRNLPSGPGFFDFYYCQTELSATPLLDVQVAPGLSGTIGVQSVTVTGYRPDDTIAPNYLNDGRYPALVAPGTHAQKNNGLVPVIALNCSRVPGCHLDGVTISSGAQYGGASAKPAPAIRVYSGSVNSVTILSSQLTGSIDVLDAENNPIGSWASRSAGGFTFVTEAPVVGPGRHSHPAALTAGGRGADADTAAHAVLVGLSGESNARFAVDGDGSMHW